MQLLLLLAMLQRDGIMSWCRQVIATNVQRAGIMSWCRQVVATNVQRADLSPPVLKHTLPCVVTSQK